MKLDPREVPARHPKIAHFLPYLVGDSLRSIARAVRFGWKYIDQNMRVDAQGFIWFLHYPKSSHEWKWKATGRHNKRGREIRVRNRDHRRIEVMDTDDVERLRSRRRGGRRPHGARAHLAKAAAHNIVVCAEAKDSDAFNEPGPWIRLAKITEDTGARVIAMTLQRAGAFQKLREAHRAGFPVALLPRGPKPDNWETEWQAMGVKKWGRWRKR